MPCAYSPKYAARLCGSPFEGPRSSRLDSRRCVVPPHERLLPPRETRAGHKPIVVAPVHYIRTSIGCTREDRRKRRARERVPKTRRRSSSVRAKRRRRLEDRLTRIDQFLLSSFLSCLLNCTYAAYIRKSIHFLHVRDYAHTLLSPCALQLRGKGSYRND